MDLKWTLIDRFISFYSRSTSPLHFVTLVHLWLAPPPPAMGLPLVFGAGLYSFVSRPVLAFFSTFSPLSVHLQFAVYFWLHILTWYQSLRLHDNSEMEKMLLDRNLWCWLKQVKISVVFTGQSPCKWLQPALLLFLPPTLPSHDHVNSCNGGHQRHKVRGAWECGEAYEDPPSFLCSLWIANWKGTTTTSRR